MDDDKLCEVLLPKTIEAIASWGYVTEWGRATVNVSLGKKRRKLRLQNEVMDWLTLSQKIEK